MPTIHFNSYDTLDDLLNDVFRTLVALPFNVKSTRGVSSEIIGASLHLKNPRARLSRTETKGKLFSSIGELLWYLAGSNELNFIKHYLKKYESESDDGVTIHGAYGPRLLNMRGNYNQIKNVLELLQSKPTTRRAVIQLFDAMDIDTGTKYKEIPCTSTLQLLIRDNKLFMHTSMRSNDAFWGLSHDIFAFTMLQEIFAMSLNVELGEYYHSVGSLHLYDNHADDVKQYLSEGFQPTTQIMPTMPIVDPWESINTVLKYEIEIRNNSTFNFEEISLDSYWVDLIKLLKIHSLLKSEDYEQVKALKQTVNEIFHSYIQNRLENGK